MGPRSHKPLLWVALLLSVATVIGASHRARKGRNALLKWEPVFVALESGEGIYGQGEQMGAEPTAEGYPTLPLSLLILTPFRALGSTLGPLAWALLKVGLAWWILLRCFQLAAGSASSFPPWAAWVVLLLSVRVLHSDVQHGNLNLLVGATVLAAFSAWQRGRPLCAGLWFALGAVLKVTPLLGLVYLARKGSVRGLVGAALGLALFAFVVPALWLGWEQNMELAGAWWRQMIAPYFAGRSLTLVQTEQINQSLLGVGARLLTDCVAVAARPPIHPSDLSINLLSLSPGTFRLVHLTGSVAVLAVLLIGTRRRGERRGPVVLGEAALVALAMLMLSERSWKQHYVLLPLPLTYLAWMLAMGPTRWPGKIAAASTLVLVTALVGLSGDAVLGDRGADLAEAYGAWLWAAVALFGTVAALSLGGGGNQGPLRPGRSP